MLNDEDELICDNMECGAELGNGKGGYFIDTPDEGYEFCSWKCVEAFARNMKK